MLRVILAIGLVLGVTAVITPPAVFACSCATKSPREHLNLASAAFVGTLSSRDDGSAAQSSAFEVTWTFQVEQVVKGELGEQVDVQSPVSGASCGFELVPGQRVGVMLYERDGQWHGGLCGQVDPDALLRAVQPPPPPDGTGPVTLLVGNRGEDPRIIALDGAGRTLAYGAGDGEVRSISVCPTSERFTELVAYQGRATRSIAVRETRTFQVVKEYTLPVASMNVMTLYCRDEAGSDIIIHEMIQTPDMVTTSLIHRLQDGNLQTLYSSEPMAEGGSAATFDFEGGVAYLTAGHRGNDIIRVDLQTGGVTPVLTVPGIEGEVDHLTSLELSPDRTRLAAFGYQPGQTAFFRVLLIDLTTEPVSVNELGLGSGVWFGSVIWLDNDTFMITTDEVTQGGAPVYSVVLEQVGAIPDWGAQSVVRADDTLYGLGWYGELIAAPLPDGPATTIRTFDNPNIFVMAAVPDEVEIERDAGQVPEPTASPAGTPARTTHPDSSPTPRETGSLPSATPTEEGASMASDDDFGQGSVLDAQSGSSDNRGWLFAVGILSAVVAGGWGVLRWLKR